MQRYCHPVQVNGGLDALSSVQLQNDAVPVLQPNSSRAAGCDGRIRTVDAARGPHIVGAAHQVHPGRPEGPGADAADAQPLALTLKVQSAASAAGDEPYSGNDDTN